MDFRRDRLYWCNGLLERHIYKDVHEDIHAPAEIPVAHAERSTLQRAARAAAIARVQEAAPEEYSVVPAGTEIWAPNPALGWMVAFSSSGVRITPDDARNFDLTLRASGYGCDHAVAPIGEHMPTGTGNRVEYQRWAGGTLLTEWYVNGPLGLEQGFTLPSAVPCRDTGDVVIELAMDSELVPVIDSAGASVAFRDGAGRTRLAMVEPHAEDAAGRPLPIWFSAGDQRIALHVDDTEAVYPVVIDPLITTQRAKLPAPNPAPNMRFGSAVSTHAHTMLVGAPGTRTAHVFNRDYGLGFVQEGELVPSLPAPGFGTAVSVWGDTAIVGAPGDNPDAPGEVYVFERVDEGMWIEQVKLVASNSAPGDGFGSAVHISGDTLIVGAPGASSSGAAYVFTRRLGAWSETARLEPSNEQYAIGFGAAVAVWRDVAMIGAPEALQTGITYVFERERHTWTESDILVPAAARDNERFGAAIALTQDTVLVGAPGAGSLGAAYVFGREDGSWLEQTALRPVDSPAVEFGARVALAGDTAVVSSGLASAAPQPRSAYVFERAGDQWSLVEELASPIETHDDGFGASVALSRNTLVIGAARDATEASEAGAVYTYSVDAEATELTCPEADTLASLMTCIRGQMPRSDSGGYVVPSTTERTDWRKTVASMLDGACNLSLPETLNGAMRAQDFVDAENGKTYCVLMETADADNDGYVDKGWGTFIVDAAAQRTLSHQAPHPYFESLTAAEAVDVFKHTNSWTYLACGAHRNANSSPSACDPDYNESDCAHSKDNMYYPTSLEIDLYYGQTAHTQLQWHGMADTTCPDLNVYLSHGLSTTPPAESNVLTLMSNVEYHNPTWAVDVPGSDTCKLNGTKNTEGRYLNGVPEADVCTTAADSSTNKFVHIEQEREYRSAADWVMPVADTWPVDAPPSPPSGLTATAGNAEVSLSWLASAGADSYNVWSSTTSGSGYSLVATGVTDLSFVDTGLSNGTTYYYVVTAVNAYGESGYSNEASATPTDGLEPPTNLSASGAKKKCNLSWDGTTTAASYNVKRSTTSGGPYTTIGTTTKENYKDVALPSGVTYYYVVTAVNGGSESAPSNEASATTK